MRSVRLIALVAGSPSAAFIASAPATARPQPGQTAGPRIVMQWGPGYGYAPPPGWAQAVAPTYGKLDNPSLGLEATSQPLPKDKQGKSERKVPRAEKYAQAAAATRAAQAQQAAGQPPPYNQAPPQYAQQPYGMRIPSQYGMPMPQQYGIPPPQYGMMPPPHHQADPRWRAQVHETPGVSKLDNKGLGLEFSGLPTKRSSSPGAQAAHQQQQAAAQMAAQQMGQPMMDPAQWNGMLGAQPGMAPRPSEQPSVGPGVHSRDNPGGPGATKAWLDPSLPENAEAKRAEEEAKKQWLAGANDKHTPNGPTGATASPSAQAAPAASGATVAPPRPASSFGSNGPMGGSHPMMMDPITGLAAGPPMGMPGADPMGMPPGVAPEMPTGASEVSASMGVLMEQLYQTFPACRGMPQGSAVEQLELEVLGALQDGPLKKRVVKLVEQIGGEGEITMRQLMEHLYSEYPECRGLPIEQTILHVEKEAFGEVRAGPLKLRGLKLLGELLG